MCISGLLVDQSYNGQTICIIIVFSKSTDFWDRDQMRMTNTINQTIRCGVYQVQIVYFKKILNKN